MTILFTANTASELTGGIVYAVTDQSTHNTPDTVANDYNTGPGGTFDGFDPDYAPEAIGIYHTSSEENIGFRIDTPTPSGDYWFHCRMQFTNTAASTVDGHLWDFYDANDDLIARVDFLNGFGWAEVYGDTTEEGNSFSFPLFLTGMCDVMISTSGGNLTMEIYLNGGVVSSATAANTGGVGPCTYMTATHDDMVTSPNSNEAWIFYSEIIVTDNEPTIGLRLATMRPDSQGDDNDMTGSPLDLNNNDGLTISTDTVGHRESWNLSAYNGPASPTSVRALVTKTRSRKGVTGPQSVRHYLRIGTTNYDAASTITPANNSPEMTVWDTNPATTSAWATSDFTGLQQGVEAES